MKSSTGVHIKSKIPKKSAEDIKLMKESCLVTATILERVGGIIKPGISTEDINRFVHDMTLEMGAVPSPLGYKGYPKSVCTSVNEVICHGIPNEAEILKSGDIINVDVTSYKSGFHGDASCMYFVGGEDACSQAARDLVWATRDALYAGIAAVKPGAHIGDIGAAIEASIQASGKKFSIVRDYTGHGLGREFHEPPTVLHFGRRGSGPRMEAGMTFTIEPMINAGSFRTVLDRADNWTVRTEDGSLSAQWEHTVLVTESGVEILTDSR